MQLLFNSFEKEHNLTLFDICNTMFDSRVTRHRSGTPTFWYADDSIIPHL